MGLSVEVVRKPPRPVPEEVAKRWAREVGQGGQECGLARAYAAARLFGSTSQVGSGASLLVDLSEQEER